MRYVPNKFYYKLQQLGMNYDEYKKSEHWQNTRKRFFKTSTRVKRMIARRGKLYCEFCFVMDRSLSLHHRTYKRLGAENLKDLILLCDDCHKECHELFNKQKNRNLWKATNEVAYRKLGHALRW